MVRITLNAPLGVGTQKLGYSNLIRLMWINICYIYIHIYIYIYIYCLTNDDNKGIKGFMIHYTVLG